MEKHIVPEYIFEMSNYKKALDALLLSVNYDFKTSFGEIVDYTYMYWQERHSNSQYRRIYYTDNACEFNGSSETGLHIIFPQQNSKNETHTLIQMFHAIYGGDSMVAVICQNTQNMYFFRKQNQVKR